MSTMLDRIFSFSRQPTNRAERAVQAQADITAYEQEEHTKWGTFLSDLEAEQMTVLGSEQARRRPLLPSASAEEGGEA